MDVEIDHRDALGVIALAGVVGSDSRLVEQAEAHGAARFGVMAGGLRAQKALLSASPRNTASTAAVAAPTARNACVEGTGRHHRIRVEIFEALRRRQRADAFQMLIGMGAENVLVAAQRRLAALEVAEVLGLQDLVEGADAVDAFRVAIRRHVPSEDGWVNSRVVMAPF